jgi:hypothetical protein
MSFGNCPENLLTSYQRYPLSLAESKKENVMIQEQQLPALQGSEKQIQWAQEIQGLRRKLCFCPLTGQCTEGP